MSQYSNPSSVHVAAIAGAPTDRVRWGPIVAGLFAAMTTLAVLGVLGVAVAGSAYDPGDNARNYGIGAGVWGAVSALLAFFIGGWLAARAAAVKGTSNGVMNGAMVWVVAIPLMLYVLMGGIGSLFRGAASAANSGVQAASNVGSGAAQQAAGDPATQQRIEDQARTAGARIQADAQQTADQVKQAVQNPENQKRAAEATAKGAWGTLVSMLLGLGAAAVGGLVGARDKHLVARHSGTGDVTVSDSNRA